MFRRFVFVLTAMAATALAVVTFQVPAYAGQNATPPSCASGQVATTAHLKVSNIPASMPPPDVTINTVGSGVITATRDTLVGSTATYRAALDAPILNAVVDYGDVTFTGLTCTTAVAPGLQVIGPLCGSLPELSARVTNHNAVAVNYTVTVGGLSKSVFVSGGGTEQVDFTTSPGGTLTATGAGKSASVGVSKCPDSKPVPGPATSKPTAQSQTKTQAQAKATTAKASASAKPSASASASAAADQKPAAGISPYGLSGGEIWLAVGIALVLLAAIGVVIWLVRR